MGHQLDRLLRRTRVPVRLIFDTADHPRSARARGENGASRHLLYEHEQLCLDLRVDPTAASQRILVGHLTDRLDPLKPIAGVAVILAHGGTVLASTLSNRQGEFRMVYEPHEALALWLSVGADYLIEVPVG